MSWFSFRFDDFAFSFLSVLLEGVPFLLLGSLLSGLIDVFVSSERISRMMPKNRTAAIGLGGLLGLIFPMCECGSVIVIRRFIKKGVPASAAVAYMMAAPIVSPLVAFSTWAAFKGQSPVLMTSLRLTLGYLIAVSIGLLVQRIPGLFPLQPGIGSEVAGRSRTGLTMGAAPGSMDFSAIVQSASLPRKFLLAVQSATADFLDVVFFLIIGAALTSVFNTAVNQEVILPFASSLPASIAVLMGLAGILALCSTTDAFIAASFATFPFAAKLGFLLFGPMFDLKLFWLYGIIFKRRGVVLLGLGLFFVIWLICWRLGAAGLLD